MKNEKLPGLILVDVQEKLFQKIAQKEELLKKVKILLLGMHIFTCPIIVSEQCPDKLGETITDLKQSLKSAKIPFLPHSKETFSCLKDEKLSQVVMSSPSTHWVVAGIEAHICILQTVRNFIEKGKKVIVPVDAVASRNLIDYRASLDEMRTMGARLTTVETILFELLESSSSPHFKEIQALVK